MTVSNNELSGLKKSYKPLLVLLFFLAIAFYIGNIIYKNHQLGHDDKSKRMDQNSRPKSVVIENIAKEDVDISLKALGTISSRNSVLVQSLIGGQLMSVHFKEGEFVKKGQLLAVIDERPYQIQFAQAEGQLLKDRASLENAKQDLIRYKTEYSSHAVSKQILDTQQALVKQTEATVRIDQAQLDNAKLQLSYCKITSPIEGLAGIRLTDPGNIIQPNGGSTTAGGIVNIVQMNPITVLFSLPEDYLPPILEKIRSHQELTVEAFDKNDHTLLAKGRLLATNDVIDVATGTIQLRAIFDNQDGLLFPNQFVNVRLLIDTLKDATVASLSAIQKGRKGDFVYLVDNVKRIHVRQVKLGATSGEKIIVTDGLSPDDLVVVDGADKLKENALVHPSFAKKLTATASQAEEKSTGYSQNDGLDESKHKRRWKEDPPPKEGKVEAPETTGGEGDHSGHEHKGHWHHKNADAD